MIPLLARGDTSWVFIIIFLTIWGLSALAGMLQKKQKQVEDSRRHEMMQNVRRGAKPRPVSPAPARPVRKAPAIFQPPPLAPQMPNRPEIPRPIARPVLKPAPIPVRTPVAVQAPQRAIPQPLPPPPAPVASAPQRRPAILITKDSFVISEIIQPPVALRESHLM